MSETRALFEIAADIRSHWPKVNPAAAPFLDAMRHLSTTSDSYGADSADGIVRYFLSNAATWRGEHARRIKAELNALLEA